METTRKSGPPVHFSVSYAQGVHQRVRSMVSETEAVADALRTQLHRKGCVTGLPKNLEIL